MRSILRIVALFWLIAIFVVSSIYAEDVSRQTPAFESPGWNDPPITLVNSGVYLHRITWTGSGTRTGCTVLLNQSATSKSGWTSLISGQDCTRDGSAMAVGYANYVRIGVTQLTGTNNRLFVRYDGSSLQHEKGFCDAIGGTTFQNSGILTDTSYQLVQTSAADKYIYVNFNQVSNSASTVFTRVLYYDWNGASTYVALPGGGSAAVGGGGWAVADDDGYLFKVPVGHALVIKALTTGAFVDWSVKGCIASKNY